MKNFIKICILLFSINAFADTKEKEDQNKLLNDNNCYFLNTTDVDRKKCRVMNDSFKFCLNGTIKRFNDEAVCVFVRKSVRTALEFDYTDQTYLKGIRDHDCYDSNSKRISSNCTLHFGDRNICLSGNIVYRGSQSGNDYAICKKNTDSYNYETPNDSGSRKKGKVKSAN